MGSDVTEAFEFEVLRNPQCVKNWLQLVKSILSSDHPDEASKANAVNVAYERALRANGYSYKLWIGYIAYRRDYTRELCSPHEWFRSVREQYDRAVEKLPMMPLLWTSFIEFAMDAAVPPRITLVRHIITRALETLPFTQHHRIWRLAKQWVNRPYVPLETAAHLWRINLLFDSSVENHRDYFHMMWEKGNACDFLTECSRFLSQETMVNDGLLRDTAFWETIRVALETKQLHFTGEVSQVAKIVQVASEYSASPMEFRISYAIFLANQGELAKARETLWGVLEDADDPAIFRRAFTAILAFEDQIIDSLALDPAIRALGEEGYRNLLEELCGGGVDPLHHLARLSQQHPLLLNQLQLRADRYSTHLWLKRVEILKEMVYDGGATTSDVIALYRQAIAQFVSPHQSVETAAAQLFESYACYLWENDLRKEAIAVVDEGAWCIRFCSVAGNALLMGLAVEFGCLTNASDLLDKIISRLDRSVSAPNCIRSKGLTRQVVTSHLQKDPRAWVMALDLAFHQHSAGGCADEMLRRVIGLFYDSSAYTAEAACYIAGRLWHEGNLTESFQEYERALVAFTGAPLAVLYILQQYLSCLCISFGENLPLHRFRELAKLGLDVAKLTMQPAPVATAEFLINCVTLESRLGFFDNAIQTARECFHLALVHRDGHDKLLFGLLDTVLEVTFRLRGSEALRQYCVMLLERHRLSPQLIQRLALWWAAVERRTGNVDKAHTVLEACCKSQDPRSDYGAVFWRMWESICATVGQFEGVQKRKQQASLKYGEAGSTPSIVANGSDAAVSNGSGPAPLN
uniref:Uncharacterized protein TCIL3000_5_1380 n=1 Tax=Trypanosoma congolense (strain IL3000) TaxID=1068625 RepID=G0UMM7_TRYCI|nr:unnamed protein product [Trypanosoma congolense IL3000]